MQYLRFALKKKEIRWLNALNSAQIRDDFQELYKYFKNSWSYWLQIWWFPKDALERYTHVLSKDIHRQKSSPMRRRWICCPRPQWARRKLPSMFADRIINSRRTAGYLDTLGNFRHTCLYILSAHVKISDPCSSRSCHQVTPSDLHLRKGWMLVVVIATPSPCN